MPQHREIAFQGDEAAPEGSAYESFSQRMSLSDPPTPSRQLPCPVVIPQRRPGDRERGFVEAYAPVLDEFGIDQDSFIDFIRATNKAVQTSKWIGGVQLAATGASFVPNQIAFGASLGVQIAAAILAKAETNWKTNSLFTRLNKDFFRPRGLFCLMMAYDPLKLVEADKTSHAEMAGNADSSARYSKVVRKLKTPVAGTTRGSDDLPETVAQLIYPESSNTNSGTGTQNPLRRLNTYFDQRAQARYAHESDGDILSHPNPPTFKHRILDPNHPASNGGLLGLVSGGHLTPNFERSKAQMQVAMQTQQDALKSQQSTLLTSLDHQLANSALSPAQREAYADQFNAAFEQQETYLQQLATSSETFGRPRRITRNILYLMIVPMPTDEEIAEARNCTEGEEGSVNVDIDATIQNVSI